MKRIEAVIRQARLAEVKRALDRSSNRGLTVSPVKEQDADGQVSVQWRGRSHVLDLVPRTRVAVLVEDGNVQATVDAIVDAARTGGGDDGTVIVTSVDEIIRISDVAAIV